MIEVFFEKDYNVFVGECAKLGADVSPGREGMLMRDGGETVGASIWTKNGGTVMIESIIAPDSYGIYYDLIVRSALNRLILVGTKEICLADLNNKFFEPLGFRKIGGVLTAKSEDIKFPEYSCSCHK